MSDEHYKCCECGNDDDKYIKYRIVGNEISESEIILLQQDYNINSDDLLTMCDIKEIEKILEREIQYFEVEVCPKCEAEDSYCCVDRWEKEVE